MSALQRILAATDFSADAEHAAVRAARLLAERPGAAGELIHVLDLSWVGELREWLQPAGEWKDKLEHEARAQLAALCERLQREHGAALRPVLRAGKVADELRAAAAGADLTVVGAWGTHPLRALALGTTAERLLRLAGRPVLVVKRPARAPYGRVLVPIDFSPAAGSLRALARAVAPAADITCLHVVAAPDEGGLQRAAGWSGTEIAQAIASARRAADAAWQALPAEGGPAGRTASFVVEQGDPASVIAEHVRKTEPDLVVLGKHGKTLSQQLLLGSVALHILGAADCDVLVAAANPGSAPA